MQLSMLGDILERICISYKKGGRVNNSGGRGALDIIYTTVHIGVEETWGGVSARSAGEYTTTFLVMVDRVKGEGVHPPVSPGWADFMIDCTPEVVIATLCVLCDFPTPPLHTALVHRIN